MPASSPKSKTHDIICQLNEMILSGNVNEIFLRRCKAEAAKLKDADLSDYCEGRNRTGTSRKGQGILSPLRLPIPPPRRRSSFKALSGPGSGVVPWREMLTSRPVRCASKPRNALPSGLIQRFESASYACLISKIQRGFKGKQGPHARRVSPARVPGRHPPCRGRGGHLAAERQETFRWLPRTGVTRACLCNGTEGAAARAANLVKPRHIW